MSEGINVIGKYLLNFLAFPIVSALVENQIPNKLLAGPQTAEELSANTEINPEKLFVYLRAVSQLGLFNFDSSTNKWSNTEESTILTSQLSESLWKWIACDFTIETMLHTGVQLKSSLPPNETLGRPNIFEQLMAKPELLGLFQNCMTQASKSNFSEVLENIDMSGCRKLLDVGGADGTLALSLAKKYPDLEFAVFDRPEVLPIAENNLRLHEMTERVKFYPGNFFENIQEGFDCILMKHIIHDWNDEKSSVILRNCRNALNTGNKMFIIEQIVDPHKDTYVSNLAADLLMRLTVGGQERSLEQFREIFSKSGFEIVAVKNVLFEYLIELRAI